MKQRKKLGMDMEIHWATPVFGMMVLPISVEITVKEKTRLVMEFVGMAGFHVEISRRLNQMCFTNAPMMTASMNTIKIVMANAFIIQHHVMVSVQKAGDTAVLTMVTVQRIRGNAIIPVLKAGRSVEISNA